MEKGVSFRTPEVLERRANEVLQKAYEKGFYDFNIPTPIDLVAEKALRLKIGFVNLNKDFKGVLGTLDFKNKTIWVDESLNHTVTQDFTKEARCNSTIAHECGHFVLHKKQYKKAEDIALFHDNSDLRTQALETQANMFMSYILMPKELMIKKWNEIDHGNYSIPHALDEMKKFFIVSKETMVYRLKSLGLLDPGF